MTTLLVAARFCPKIRLATLQNVSKQTFIRNFAQDEREVLSRTARRQTLKERVMAPASDSAFNIGKGALAAGSALGIAALCYYGLGLSNEAGALEKSIVWPQYVKDRIKSTYFYFAGSLGVTAGSAVLAFQSPAVRRVVTRNGFMGMMVSLAAIVGTGMVAQSIEYKPGFGTKQIFWLVHTATMGAVLAPMCYLGGPLLIRAAWYTAGVVGGLSTIAVCAPSEKFLMMGAPLGMGLGAVFVASLGSAFLPPTTALGAGLYSISLYGGLLLFSAFMLYDTQRIIAQAERYSTAPAAYGARPYDPINAAMSIYMDTLNIFIRIASILAGGGNQRKR